MTLSLISLLSQDISGLWLLLKTSTGASGLRVGAHCELMVLREKETRGPSGDGLACHPHSEPQSEQGSVWPCGRDQAREMPVEVEMGAPPSSGWGRVWHHQLVVLGCPCSWNKGAQSLCSPWKLEWTFMGAPLFQFPYSRAGGTQEGSPGIWWVLGLAPGCDWPLAVTPGQRCPTALRAQCTLVSGSVDTEVPSKGGSLWSSLVILLPSPLEGRHF